MPYSEKMEQKKVRQMGNQNITFTTEMKFGEHSLVGEVDVSAS